MQCAEALGYCLGFKRHAVCRGNALAMLGGVRDDLDAGHIGKVVAGVFGVPFVKSQLDELVAAKHAFLAEELVHEADDVAMRAEVAVELACQAARVRLKLAHVALMRQVGAHVGPAEAIDALLGVAHGAKALVAVGEVGNEGNLQLACVLKLVDHDEAEPVAIAVLHLGCVFKCVKCLVDEVVLVEHAQGGFALLVEAMYLACHAHEAGARSVSQTHLTLAAKLDHCLAEQCDGGGEGLFAASVQVGGDAGDCREKLLVREGVLGIEALERAPAELAFGHVANLGGDGALLALGVHVLPRCGIHRDDGVVHVTRDFMRVHARCDHEACKLASHV